ncbi:PepSY-associated TM helix domain-containing protein [Xanthocytophaga agilis]|uniref:PepSY-associated TM helix domain-containing protein n=1 Tax=Xanthocytophaga agilis TaxID=3048010 RepID=A0AAE3UE75_9BACT|nr:PepSY-associated TM helix domain-containing protein [Xanthocytophaga agilis]MDJ1499952.1 PepSY-associated TM helix domain-containing protein [Xanthocytophaga agilis]
MTLKKIIGQVHLWLGLSSGLIVLFLGITGCILAFQREIENATRPYLFSKVQNKPLLPPSELRKIADAQLPGKKAHGIQYEPGKSAHVSYYNADPEYYYIVFIDPYTGKVLKTKNMNEDFFRIVIMGHFYLWLPPNIGQPIVASATLIFVVLLITGIVLWWPKNKAAAKQRFWFNWKENLKWKRKNYDLHNVLGFYVSWVIIFIALTGLVWGFQWFAKSLYWTTSGGKEMVQFYETLSDTTQIANAPATPAMDQLWRKVKQDNPSYTGSIEVHVPTERNSSIEVAMNPDPTTFWQADYRYYDQYTLKEIPVTHVYGRLQNASVADKIMRMNYDIHVGAVLGLPGKIIAFVASLICASLPVTGFYIWYGRRKKNAKGNKNSENKPTRKNTQPRPSFAKVNH